MKRWPSGRVSASAYCGCWFDLQWWRSRCALLMRPNMVETAVQCSVIIYQFLHPKLYIYTLMMIYIYIYIYIYISSSSQGNSAEFVVCLSVCLSPFVHIFYGSGKVLKTASSIRTKLICVSLCWSANTGTSIHQPIRTFSFGH